MHVLRNFQRMTPAPWLKPDIIAILLGRTAQECRFPVWMSGNMCNGYGSATMGIVINVGSDRVSQAHNLESIKKGDMA